MEKRLLLKVREVAEALGMSRAAVYNLIQRGTLPAVRLDSNIRVSRAVLERLISEQGQGAAR